MELHAVRATSHTGAFRTQCPGRAPCAGGRWHSQWPKALTCYLQLFSSSREKRQEGPAPPTRSMSGWGQGTTLPGDPPDGISTRGTERTFFFYQTKILLIPNSLILSVFLVKGVGVTSMSLLVTLGFKKAT